LRIEQDDIFGFHRHLSCLWATGPDTDPYGNGRKEQKAPSYAKISSIKFTKQILSKRLKRGRKQEHSPRANAVNFAVFAALRLRGEN
jgi:hypothetical protein